MLLALVITIQVEMVNLIQIIISMLPVLMTFMPLQTNLTVTEEPVAPFHRSRAMRITNLQFNE